MHANLNHLHVIILAAGKGIRMHAELPKVLQQVGGRALLARVITTAQALQPAAIHVVCSADENGRKVRQELSAFKVNWIEQREQLGTGHAVQQVLPHLLKSNKDAQVLILYGDVPLITVDTLQKLLVAAQKDEGAAITLLTAVMDEPAGYGRIVRGEDGSVKAIVEDKDANHEQLAIKEINSGIMLTSVPILQYYLPLLTPNNKGQEYYLTTIVASVLADGYKVTSIKVQDTNEVLGANDKKQLQQLERCYQRRIADRLMLQHGVTLIDAARFDFRGDETELNVGHDVVIDANVILAGKITIGANCMIGPNSFLRDVTLGDNVVVKANCVLEGATIEDDCVIGPFARIRPTTHIASGAHVGNFVEVKNSKIGKVSKANHLSYVGDAIVGDDVNIGAGVITCNYDSVNKYQTIIEDGAFIGSNAQLVAPVKIGRNATIGAGSTITKDAPADKLTLARAQQVTLANWRRPTKGERKSTAKNST